LKQAPQVHLRLLVAGEEGEAEGGDGIADGEDVEEGAGALLQRLIRMR
jgi:hypothetical protein